MGLLLAVSSVPIVLFLVVPIVVILAQTFASGLLPAYLSRPVVAEALRLSLLTSGITLILSLVLGTPLAYLLARYDFPGKAAVDTLVDLPIVLPPAVAGIALLLTLGRRGVVGSWLSSIGIELAFTTAAVVLAQLFVAAPFYIRSVRAGFATVDRGIEEAARVDGAGPFTVFRRVTAPLAFPSLVGGVVLAWAKAVGEFGATILFAGSFIGRTQTMPLAIYQALESDLMAALVIATILVIMSFVVLGLFRLATSALPGADLS
jgi:molybdate transport system permease protein